MNNLIPEFKAGDRVMVTTHPLEVKCVFCGRHAACYGFYDMSAKGTVLEGISGIMCPCCHKENYITNCIPIHFDIHPKHHPKNYLFAVPVTWLTPLEESHE